MKTKNEYGDWLKAVDKMERGATIEEATNKDVPLVRQGLLRSKRKSNLVSEGQLKAIRREFNGK